MEITVRSVERMARILHYEFSRMTEPDALWDSCTDDQRERWRRSAFVVLKMLRDQSGFQPASDQNAQQLYGQMMNSLAGQASAQVISDALNRAICDAQPEIPAPKACPA